MTARSGHPLLRIDDLTVSYDGGLEVVDGLSLHVRSGEMVALVGESGSGKSQTGLAVLGLCGARARLSGTIVYGQRPFDAADQASRSTVRGRGIAMVFQDAAATLNPVRTIGGQLIETIRHHRRLDGTSARQEAVRLLDRVGIADPRRGKVAYPHEFSGGMNQRAMIALALAGGPRLIIADEPTAALDPLAAGKILTLLDDLRCREGLAVIFISHSLGQVRAYADRTYVLHKGRLVESGATADVLKAPRHPYVHDLIDAEEDPLRAAIRLDRTGRTADGAGGGCRFASRCGRASPVCVQRRPVLSRLPDGRHAACHHPIGDGP